MKLSTRDLRVPVVLTDDDRAAFARYLGRSVDDDEIRERLADVCTSYLHVTIRFGKA